MKELEVLRRLKEYIEIHAYNGERIQALSFAINLVEQVEKVEGVLPKEKFCHIHGSSHEGCKGCVREEAHNACLHQVKLNLVKAGLTDKPSQRRIKDTDYQCEHKSKNEIDGDCVWCALSVAETGLKKQREMRLKAEAQLKGLVRKPEAGELHKILIQIPPSTNILKAALWYEEAIIAKLEEGR